MVSTELSKNCETLTEEMVEQERSPNYENVNKIILHCWNIFDRTLTVSGVRVTPSFELIRIFLIGSRRRWFYEYMDNRNFLVEMINTMTIIFGN